MNDPLRSCAECASACDYDPFSNLYSGYGTYSLNVCASNGASCPSGTVPVDCNFYTSYQYACKNLVCGDAGVASGNSCVQQSSLDSSCVNVAPKTYGWTDNTALLSCTCYDTTSATINQYTKKADGTACTKNGQSGTCLSGACKLPFSCSATLSVSATPSTAPCTVSASVSATGCDGQTFAIKDSAGTKCSGIITAGSGSCSSWSISAGTSYSLYLSGSSIPSDTKTAGGC